MKKYLKFLPYFLFLFCLTIVSCSEDDEVISDTNNLSQTTALVNTKSAQSLNYLNDIEAKKLAKDVSLLLKLYADNIEGSTLDLSEELVSFYSGNDSLLQNITTYIDLEEITINNEGNPTPLMVEVEDVQETEFLSEIQKNYAISLLNKAKANDFAGLVALKDKYYDEVKNHQDLQLFSLIFALIAENELVILAKSDPDCHQQALQSAIIDGAIGMVAGVIAGGLGGFAVGGVLSFGTLAIPAGGAGAVVGAVFGGLAGFAEGYLRSYLTCKFWSWSW